MNGEYTESLPSNSGKLVVTKNSWHISFYFSGPDLRYNGTFHKIPSSSVDLYIEAYREAWKTYKEAKDKMAVMGSGQLKINGKMGLVINVGGYRDGICLTSYHMCLNSENSIALFIRSLQWAKQRAEEVMKLFKSI